MKEKKEWLVPLIGSLISLFAFLALLLPFISAHPITKVEYDWTNYKWVFEDASRIKMNGSVIFGNEYSSPIWPFYIVYGLLIVGMGFGLAGIKFKKLRMAGALILAVTGVLFLISNTFYGYANSLASLGKISKANPGVLDDPTYGPGNREDLISNYILVADARLAGGAILAAVFSFLSAFTLASSSMGKEDIKVRDMTEIGVLCGAAIVLGLISHYIPNIPSQAGSISLALLPLYLLSLRHGPVKGFFAASLVYGLITCITDGYGIFLFPLDYLIAFSGTCIIGFFRKFIIGKDVKAYSPKALLFIFVSILLSCLVRLVGSGASSMLNYGYSLKAALIANSIYIFVSGLISIVAIYGGHGLILKLNKAFPVKNLEEE